MKNFSNFERGMARTLDIGANFKRELSMERKNRDKFIVAKDWENVGKSIRTAIGNYRERTY